MIVICDQEARKNERRRGDGPLNIIIMSRTLRFFHVRPRGFESNLCPPSGWVRARSRSSASCCSTAFGSPLCPRVSFPRSATHASLRGRRRRISPLLATRRGEKGAGGFRGPLPHHRTAPFPRGICPGGQPPILATSLRSRSSFPPFSRGFLLPPSPFRPSERAGAYAAVEALEKKRSVKRVSSDSWLPLHPRLIVMTAFSD